MTHQPGRPSVPLSQLVPMPRCPLCGKGFYGLGIDVLTFRADFACRRKGCPQHWWAMRLHAGAVEPQLAAAFSPELAAELIIRFALPDSMAQPLYWQLALTGHEAYHRNRAREEGRDPGVPSLPNLRRPA